MRKQWVKAVSHLTRQKEQRPDEASGGGLRRGLLLVGGGAAAVVLGVSWLASSEASPSAANDDMPFSDAPPLNIDFGVIRRDSDVDHDALLAAARVNADLFYENRSAGRLSLFSPTNLAHFSDALDSPPQDASLTPDSIAFGELGAAPIITVRERREDEAAYDPNQEMSAFYKGVARSLGTFRSGGIRPAALEAAMTLAAWQLIAGVGQDDISAEERHRQQIAFLSSGRLQDLAATIGGRVMDAWTPPTARFIPDGALVSVVLDDQMGIAGLSIERSTGLASYDHSVAEALYRAAPFSELADLQPWLRDTMETLLFTFGAPPASPEEFRRRQSAGELSLFRGQIGDLDKRSADFLEFDHFQRMIDAIAQELSVLNASRWAGSLSRDVTLQVELSVPLGVVMDIDVVRGSGDIQFDRIAVSAVDNAAPFRDLRHLPTVEQSRYQKFVVHLHPNGAR